MILQSFLHAAHPKINNGSVIGIQSTQERSLIDIQSIIHLGTGEAPSEVCHQSQRHPIHTMSLQGLNRIQDHQVCGTPLQGEDHSRGELVAELPFEGGSKGFILAEPGEAQRNSIQDAYFSV